MDIRAAFRAEAVRTRLADILRTYSRRGVSVDPAYHEALVTWVVDGEWRVGLVDAVVRNDLANAVLDAPADFVRSLPAIIGWLYRCAPSRCFGSPGSRDRWMRESPEERLRALAYVLALEDDS